MLSGLVSSNIHQGEFRMTATQNLMISKVEESKRIYRKFSTKKWVMERYKLNSSNSMACVAFPSCGLAMAEAKYLPSLITKIEGLYL